MKKYVKAKVIAKNLPSGSYAAGCPAKGANGEGCIMSSSWLGGPRCKSCERSA